jgi:hypothetical protein
MMKKNTPNARPPDSDYDSFEDGLADLRGILNRSAAAADPRGYPQDDAYLEENDRYQEENARSQQASDRHRQDRGYPQDRFYPGEHDDRYLGESGYGRPNAGPAYPTNAAYGYAEEPEPHEAEPYEAEPYDEYDSQPPRFDSWPLRRRSSVSLRILLGVIAAAAVAVLFALFTSDATRAIIANAKEAVGVGVPDRQDRTAAPEPANTQLTAGDLQLKDPARYATQSIKPTVRQRAGSSAVALAAREDVATAYSASPSPYQGNASPYQGNASPYQGNPSPYQSAPQSRALPVATPPAAAPAIAPPSVGSVGTTPARRLAADELANLMRRARSLLAAGDIPSARLLLERAADAQEASAAFMLAQTYDPVVLGTQDARRIVPDPATARAWYERAAQLGSTEAQRRLGQLPN